jgi:hypothetical protein
MTKNTAFLLCCPRSQGKYNVVMPITTIGSYETSLKDATIVEQHWKYVLMNQLLEITS